MKRLVIMGMTLLMLGGMSGCNKSSSKREQSSSPKTEVSKPSALDNAKANVSSLFMDSSHGELLEGTTLETIESIENDAQELKPSKTKDRLLTDVKKAKKLWPAFAKAESKRAATENSELAEKLDAEEASKAAEEKESKEAEESSKAESKSVADAKAASKASTAAKYKATYPGTKNHVYGSCGHV